MKLFSIGLITILLVFIYILQSRMNYIEKFKSSNVCVSNKEKTLELKNYPFNKLENFSKFKHSR
jgi:hypothetical protein